MKPTDQDVDVPRPIIPFPRAIADPSADALRCPHCGELVEVHLEAIGVSIDPAPEAQPAA